MICMEAGGLSMEHGVTRPPGPAGGEEVVVTWTVTNTGSVKTGATPCSWEAGAGLDIVSSTVDGVGSDPYNSTLPALEPRARTTAAVTLRVWPTDTSVPTGINFAATTTGGLLFETVAILPVGRVDLKLSGNPAAGTVNADQLARFGWKLENGGPSVAGNTTVRATLPAGVVFDSADGGGALQADGTVLWQLGFLGPKRPHEVTVTAKASAKAQDPLVATAVASSDTPATSPAVPVPVTLTLRELATLTCAEPVVRPEKAVAGRDQVTVGWTFHNAGPSTVRGLAVTATLPSALSFVSATRRGALQNDGKVVRWAFPSVEPGDLTVAVTARVSPDATGEATVEATAAASTTDAKTGKPITLTIPGASTTVTAEAELALRGAPTDPPSVVAGDRDHPATFRWTLTDTGSSTATGVTARATLPSNATFVSAKPTATRKNTPAGTELTWDLGALAPNRPIDLTVTAWPAPDVLGALIATARADAKTPDPETGKPATTAEAPSTAQVTAKAQLRITETRCFPTAVQEKDQLALSWHVVNTGPSVARKVVRTVDLPKALTLDTDQKATLDPVDLPPDPHGRWFTVGTVVGSTDGGEVEVIGRFTGTGSTEVRQSIEVPAEKRKRPANHFPSGFPAISLPPPFGGGASGGDNEGKDDHNDDEDEKNRTTGLKFTEARADPEKVEPGGDLTYSWTLKNTGRKVAAKNVCVTLTLPEDITPTKVDGLNALPTPRVITGWISELGPGTSRSVSVRATVGDSATGELSARAYAVSAQAYPVWKTATATVEVTSNLDLNGTVAPNPADPGKPVTYRWVLTAKGPSSASSVTATITVPEGLTAPAGKVTEGGSQQAAWHEDKRELVFDGLGTLEKGASLTIEATATVDQGTPGPLAATALARAADAPKVTNTLTAELKPASILTGTAVPSPVIAGRDLTLVWTLTHTGGPAAERIDLTAELPSSTTYLASSHAGAPTKDGKEIVWPTIDRLEPGGQDTVTVTVLVDPAAKEGTPLPAVTATAKAGSTAEATGTIHPVPVTRASTLAVTGTGRPSPVAAGRSASLVWTVVNLGPSVASGATTELVLPPELGSPKVTVSNGAGTSGGPGTTPLPDVEPGVPVTVTATGTAGVDDLARPPGPVSGRATVKDLPEAVARVEIDSDAVLVLTPDADTAKQRAVDAGATVAFTWTAARTGACATGPAALRVVLPPELTATEVRVDGKPASSLSQSDGQLVVGLDGLAAGEKQTVRVTARVQPQTDTTANGPEPLAVVARLRADGADFVEHTAVLDVTARSAVRIDAFQLPYPVAAGAETRLVWSLGNDGPSSARNTSFVLTLPRDFTFLDATVDTLPRGGTVDPGHPGRWTVPVGDVAPGEAAQIAVRIAVGPDPGDRKPSVTRSATVGTTTGLSGGSDPVPVVLDPRVLITTAVSPTAPRVGDNVTHVWNLTNTGRATARGATFDVTLEGAGFSPDHGSTTARITTPDGRTALTLAVPVLAAMAEQTVTLTGKVTAAGTLTATPVLKDGTGATIPPTPAPATTTVEGPAT
ncbi:hypothetical protein AB0E96_21575 [Kitasatospora sp. NPDC036755]|uniref:hypothetical protein n=1 Tax=Kitasatospora sp. NPDC036755 TaxID=3154600 RepID=UPI0033D1BE9A